MNPPLNKAILLSCSWTPLSSTVHFTLLCWPKQTSEKLFPLTVRFSSLFFYRNENKCFDLTDLVFVFRENTLHGGKSPFWVC